MNNEKYEQMIFSLHCMESACGIEKKWLDVCIKGDEKAIKFYQERFQTYIDLMENELKFLKELHGQIYNTKTMD